MKVRLQTWIVKSAAWSARGYREGEQACREDGSLGKIRDTGIERIGIRQGVMVII